MTLTATLWVFLCFVGFSLFKNCLPVCHTHAHNNNDNNKCIIIKSGQQHCTHTFYSSSLTRTQLVAAAAGSAAGSVLDRSVHLVSSKCMSIQFRICPKILMQPSLVSQSLHSLPSASLPTPARRQRWRSLSIVFFFSSFPSNCVLRQRQVFYVVFLHRIWAECMQMLPN